MSEPWKVVVLKQTDDDYEAEVTVKGANSAYPEEETVVAEFYSAEHAYRAVAAVNLLPEVLVMLAEYAKLEEKYAPLLGAYLATGGMTKFSRLLAALEKATEWTGGPVQVKP